MDHNHHRRNISDGYEHSDDGQLRTPHYMVNHGGDKDSSNEDDTPDSLEIKPPQSIGRYDKVKKAGTARDKKHSREHRHRERGGGGGGGGNDSANQMRERNMRGERPHGGVSGGGGSAHSGSGRSSLEARYHNSKSRSSREERNDSRAHPASNRYEKIAINRNEGRAISEQYHSKSVYSSEREREKSRSKVGNYDRKRDSPTKTDAEREMDDLRSKLLSKRSRQDIERKIGEHQHYQEYSRAAEKGIGRAERTEKRGDKEHGKHRMKQRNPIETIDSPENYGDIDVLNAGDKQRAEDPELIARRAKLLDAEREMLRRKQLAREELKARREMQRERDEFGQQQQQSPPPSPSVKRRHHRSEHKRKHHDVGDVEVVQISDNSDHEDDDAEAGSKYNDDDDEEDTASDTASNTNSEYSEHDENSDDEELPGSPMSIGDLSKSDHRRRHSRTKSRSPRHSGSPHRRSPSGSRSRTTTPSPGPQNRDRASRPVTPTSDFEKDKPNDCQPTNEIAVAVVPDQNAAIDGDASPDSHLPNYFPGLQGCRSVEEFKCLNRIAEGTYGIVYRAQDKRTEEIVALKRLKMEKEKEGFPITSLREINTLLKGQHPNIVTVREIVVGSNMDKIFIVMDYVEHDFKTLMETMQHRKQSFLPGEVKCLTQQLLRAVAHLHDNWILHRDLKTSNLLLSHKGILKVGDFGLAREYGSPLKPYTSVVVTLWYRAPELLLCCKEYSTPIDMWSVGCIFAEFLAMQALFPGQSETDQLNKIFKFLGTPNENIWPGYNQLPAVQKMKFTEFPKSNLREKFGHRSSELGLQLLQGLLTYDPKQRFTAEKALKSEYFKELPLPIDPAMLPTWPAKSELGARKALASSPKPPSGGGQFKKLGANDLDENHGFILGASMDARQMAMGAGFSLKF